MMSYMKVIRREKNNGIKDSRWDRIKKRYSQNTPTKFKSDAIRRIIEIDFIGKQNQRLMNGEYVAENLNPVLVMDLRHKMFQKIPRQLPLATVANQKTVDSCVVHNMAIEERYINNELRQLRQQLEKNRQRNTIKLFKQKENSSLIDNKRIMISLEATSKHIEDFYATPINALQEVQNLYELTSRNTNNTYKRADYSNQINESYGQISNSAILEKSSLTLNEQKCNHEMQNHLIEEVNYENMKNEETRNDFESSAIHYNPELNTLLENKCNELNFCPHTDLFKDSQIECVADMDNQRACCVRSVRFEDEVEVRKFNRENSSCSNTSDGIDSVISDLAEEALMELKEEAEAILRHCQTEEKANCSNDKTVSQTIKPTEALIIRRLELSVSNNNVSQSKDCCEFISTTDEETVSNQEQDYIIEQLFQSKIESNSKSILRKYFLKWIHYTTLEKIEKENYTSKNDRIQKINIFLNQIRKEKTRKSKAPTINIIEDKKEDFSEQERQGNTKLNRGSIQITKKYQNKIKIQQDIIDSQKLKLERQERIIMELKLNKLSEESCAARQEIKNELKAVIRSGDPKAKAKAKCLQLIGDLRDDDDDEFARLQGKSMLMPKFLEKMQERALERSIRHEQARRRRLQHDAEREAQKMAAEEAKRVEDEEAKRMRIEALKSKRRQEKMEKIIREREKQRARDNYNKAIEFSKRLLLKRIGFECFKRLLNRKRENKKNSENFRRFILKRACFVSWRNYYILIRDKKLQLSEEFHCKMIKRYTFESWKSYILNAQSKMFIAIDWHDLKICESIFTHWFGYTLRMKMIDEMKMHQAQSHHEWHLKWKVLDCWQRLPQILQLEKETEERRQRWRMKIWELLPDYKPNPNELLLH